MGRIRAAIPTMRTASRKHPLEELIQDTKLEPSLTSEGIADDVIY
jgi:hypothetical protein